MTTAKRTLCDLAFIVVMALAITAAWNPAPVSAQTNRAPIVCAEDEPCWNCATMGNRLCGNPAGFLLSRLAAREP